MLACYTPFPIYGVELLIIPKLSVLEGFRIPKIGPTGWPWHLYIMLGSRPSDLFNMKYIEFIKFVKFVKFF